MPIAEILIQLLPAALTLINGGVNHDKVIGRVRELEAQGLTLEQIGQGLRDWDVAAEADLQRHIDEARAKMGSA